MTVAAIAAVLGGRKALKRKVETPADLHGATTAGLPVTTLPMLAKMLKIERRTLAKVVGISDRTLSRRLAGGSKMSMEESDRTVRLATVMAKAIDTFGTEAKAASWMQSPNIVMEGKAPLELMSTDAGVRWVQTILGRIDYGIYS